MISTTSWGELVRGIASFETTDRGVKLHRLPDWVTTQFPDPQLLAMESQPSGVRVVFRTAATSVELVTHSNRIVYSGADRPRGRMDVFIDGAFLRSDALEGGDEAEVDLRTGATKFRSGTAHSTLVRGLSTAEKLVELWLPHNEALELIALLTDAPVTPVLSDEPVWVHHGSSISQGSNATGPSGIWPAVAARIGGVALVNLGLGGSALVDPFAARVIRDTSADVISVKLGINVVNADSMRLRAFVPAVHGFLDTIRDGHPDTPLALISPIFCGIHENAPGPVAIDAATYGSDQVKFTATGDPSSVAEGRLTLAVIRRELRSLIERRSSDTNLHYLDGTALYGEVDARDLPLPDGLHPSSAAHRLIGERFASYAFAEGGPFARIGFSSKYPSETPPRATSTSL